METFADPLASLLSFFYDVIPSYGAAIAMLTITVMIVLLPLTIKGTRSMLAMQRLSPDIKKLQDKHKNDRQKLNEEVMALYRDNKIQPLSGCLPLILQIPVFLVLYNVINGLTHHNGTTIAPKYLSPSSDLYQDLVADGGTMKSFGIDLANSASGHHASVLAAVPYFILILIMVGAQYWQQHQIMSRNPSSADTPQAKQMRMLQKVYPPFFGIISLNFAAALVLYWVISSLFRVLQQWGMYRFDPLLKTQVASAHKEAEQFLKEDDGKGRAQKAPQKGGANRSKKKRKGR